MMSEILFSASIPGVFAEEAERSQRFSMATRHFHKSYELYFLLSGERFYFIEQDTYLVREGMAVLVNRDQIHKTSSLGNAPLGSHRRFLLQLESPALDPILTSLGCPILSELGRTHWGVVQFPPSEWEQCLFLIDSLKHEFGRLNEHSRPMIFLNSISLLLLYCRTRQRMERDIWKTPVTARYRAATGQYQKIHEIAQYLQNNSSSQVSLDSLARRFFLSKSYLTRIFKAVTGFTVNEYLTMARIKKAQLLLAQTSLSVSEIAEQTGFSTSSYFVRTFKTITGSTPLPYRKSQAASQDRD